MLAGIKISQELISTFEEDFKIRNKHKYLILAYDNNSKEIEIVKKGSSDETYEDFLSNFPSDDCRYALYLYDYETEGGKRSKIVLYYWRPKESTGKSKMIYACTINTLKYTLNGIKVSVQGDNLSDFDSEIVTSRCIKV